MNTCEESVFDVINGHTRNLEILAYNFYYAISGLQSNKNNKVKKKKKDYNRCI